MAGSNKDAQISLGVQKTDFMKNSSFNFIENERMSNSVQKGAVFTYQADNDSAIGDGKHCIAKSEEIRTASSKMTELGRTSTELIPEETMASTESRQEPGRYGPKRYTTTCFFQPKQNPVSYSETVILTLGSSKKHYFDTIMYQTKLIPFRWTESMTTSTPNTDEIQLAEHEAFVEVPNFHYMSLEPQQNAAFEKQIEVEAM